MDELLHDGFHFDVDSSVQCIDCQVQIECLDQRCYSGRVYTVDPLTQRYEDSLQSEKETSSLFSVVLLDESSNRVHIVLRPDIIQMKIVDRQSRSFVDPFVPAKCPMDDDGQTGSRLEKIRSFLSSKRIPFEEKLDESAAIELFIQNGIVQIRSPYQLSSISGTNEIVLSRLKQLLKAILS